MKDPAATSCHFGGVCPRLAKIAYELTFAMEHESATHGMHGFVT
jgi:hypothetical protein